MDEAAVTNIKGGLEVKGVDGRHIREEHWRLMGTTEAVGTEQEGDEICSKSEAVPFDRTQEKTGSVNTPKVGVMFIPRASSPLWGLVRANSPCSSPCSSQFHRNTFRMKGILT